MTYLIKKFIKKKRIGVFPIYENWGDIGSKEVLSKLNIKYKS